jgi:hypothetical protein
MRADTADQRLLEAYGSYGVFLELAGITRTRTIVLTQEGA